MSTQLIGFSIGGICRRFLVNPPSMSTFVSVQKKVWALNSRSQSGRIIWFRRLSLIRSTLRPMPVLVVIVVSVVRGSSSIALQRPPFGIWSPVIYSKHSATSPGYAGSHLTMSRSTRCLVSSTEWEWAWSLLIGVRSLPSDLLLLLPGGVLLTHSLVSSASFGSLHHSFTTRMFGVANICPSLRLVLMITQVNDTMCQGLSMTIPHLINRRMKHTVPCLSLQLFQSATV